MSKEIIMGEDTYADVRLADKKLNGKIYGKNGSCEQSAGRGKER